MALLGFVVLVVACSSLRAKFRFAQSRPCHFDLRPASLWKAETGCRLLRAEQFVPWVAQRTAAAGLGQGFAISLAGATRTDQVVHVLYSHRWPSTVGFENARHVHGEHAMHKFEAQGQRSDDPERD